MSLFPFSAPSFSMKTRSFIVLIVLFLLVVGAAYVFLTAPPISEEALEQELEALPPRFDAAYFQRPPFSALEDYGKAPQPETGGRPYPFQK